MTGFKAFAAMTSAALLGAAVANASVTRADDPVSPADAGAADERCIVQVERDGSAGSFALTRLVQNNGQCVCVVKTGPSGQGGSAESSVASLLNSRSCADAPPAVQKAMAAGGGISAGVLIVAGVGVVAGAIAIADGGSDSPGG